MRYCGYWVVSLLLTGLAVAAEETRPAFANPVCEGLADPCVFLENGVYYLYGTNDGHPGTGIPVFTSPDLAHWEAKGLAFQPTDKDWGRWHFWAPYVLRRGSEYFLFYCASANETPNPPFHMHLCIGKASSPLGPFAE